MSQKLQAMQDCSISYFAALWVPPLIFLDILELTKSGLVGGVVDTYKSFVWEPALVKLNAVTAATEAACLVLSIDETVRNPRSEQPGGGGGGMPAGGMGGRGMGMMGRGRGRGGRGMRR